MAFMKFHLWDNLKKIGSDNPDDDNIHYTPMQAVGMLCFVFAIILLCGYLPAALQDTPSWLGWSVLSFGFISFIIGSVTIGE